MKEFEEFVGETEKQRQEEIKEGKNGWTAYPLYVVYSVGRIYVDESIDYQVTTCLAYADKSATPYHVCTSQPMRLSEKEFSNYVEGEGKPKKTEFIKRQDMPDEYVYIALGKEEWMTEPEFEKYYPSVEEGDIPKEDFRRLKRGFYDRFETCCFTMEAAEEFIKNERHNLSDPYIWVHSTPWRNLQLREVGALFGDRKQ